MSNYYHQKGLFWKQKDSETTANGKKLTGRILIVCKKKKTFTKTDEEVYETSMAHQVLFMPLQIWLICLIGEDKTGEL